MANTTPTAPTPEQIEAARAMVAAADQAVADATLALHTAYLQPVVELCSSEAYATVLHGLEAMLSTYEDDGSFSVHVQALSEIMPRLASIAGVTIASDDTVEA